MRMTPSPTASDSHPIRARRRCHVRTHGRNIRRHSRRPDVLHRRRPAGQGAHRPAGRHRTPHPAVPGPLQRLGARRYGGGPHPRARRTGRGHRCGPGALKEVAPAARLARRRQPLHRALPRRGGPGLDVPALRVPGCGQQDRPEAHQDRTAADAEVLGRPARPRPDLPAGGHG